MQTSTIQPALNSFSNSAIASALASRLLREPDSVRQAPPPSATLAGTSRNGWSRPEPMNGSRMYAQPHSQGPRPAPQALAGAGRKCRSHCPTSPRLGGVGLFYCGVPFGSATATILVTLLNASPYIRAAGRSNSRCTKHRLIFLVLGVLQTKACNSHSEALWYTNSCKARSHTCNGVVVLYRSRTGLLAAGCSRHHR